MTTNEMKMEMLHPILSKLNIRKDRIEISDIVSPVSVSDDGSGSSPKHGQTSAFDTFIRSKIPRTSSKAQFIERKLLLMERMDKLKGKAVFKSTEILRESTSLPEETARPLLAINGSSNFWINHMRIHGQLVPMGQPVEDPSVVNSSAHDPSISMPVAAMVNALSQGREGSPSRSPGRITFSEARELSMSKSVLSLEAGDANNNDDIPLPDYSCTVQKEGFVNRIYEIEDFVASSKKTYKMVYCILWGTILKEFDRQPTSDDYAPLKIVSLQFALVSITKDMKNKSIVRVTTPSNRLCMQFDLQTEAQKWHDSLEMAIAISSSLETRELPKGSKLNSGSSRQQRGRPQRLSRQGS